MRIESKHQLKVSYFQSVLLGWFDLNQRVFPWRNADISNYQIIISEVLLQRTKAETVSRFYQKFITAFPNWEDLINADLDNIEEFLRPIGLFKQRAKRLKDLAEHMVGLGGIIPDDRKKIDKIPMLGQYIANSIELQIFKRKMPLLDVNMARVLERFFKQRKLADIRYDPFLQNLAFEIVNVDRSKDLNWAVLDFAAIICKARNPMCTICPINSKCNYFINIG